MPFVITPAPRRRRRLTLLAVCAVGGAAVGGFAASHSFGAAHGSSAATATAVAHLRDAVSSPAKNGPAKEPPASKPGAEGRGAAENSGGGGDVVTVFSDVPTVTHLDPDLLAALRRAATDAADARGIRFVVNSGWRSADDQAGLLDDAVKKYGSKAAAEKWVATPDTSEHVKGEAVDLGPMKATDWLAQHGAAYGLCQIYANESWHYELRPAAVKHGCPAMYADPTQDPRMQQ
jgi:hypothetical protein